MAGKGAINFGCIDTGPVIETASGIQRVRV